MPEDQSVVTVCDYIAVDFLVAVGGFVDVAYRERDGDLYVSCKQLKMDPMNDFPSTLDGWKQKEPKGPDAVNAIDVSERTADRKLNQVIPRTLGWRRVCS